MQIAHKRHNFLMYFHTKSLILCMQCYFIIQKLKNMVFFVIKNRKESKLMTHFAKLVHGRSVVFLTVACAFANYRFQSVTSWDFAPYIATSLLDPALLLLTQEKPNTVSTYLFLKPQQLETSSYDVIIIIFTVAVATGNQVVTLM